MSSNLVDIPPSRLVSCTYCAERLDSNAPGTFQRACGWVRVRGKGINALHLSVRQHRFACAECIDKLKHKIAIGQLSLLGMDVEEGDG